MDEAMVEAALNSEKHPAKAEQLFYLLKLIAGNGKIIEKPFEAVRKYFTKIVAYRYVNQLEEIGAIQRVMGGWRNKEIIELRLLKDDVVIALKKRGRKPGSGKKSVAPSECDCVKQPVKNPEIQINHRKRIIVFIDENELIRVLQNGIAFDLDSILEEIKQRLPGHDLIRVFVYISAKTEDYHREAAKTLFIPDRPLVRYIKTGNQPDVVDRRMREDMIFWSENNLADIFLLATADGGLDFQLAVATIKHQDHKVMILEAAGVVGRMIARNAQGVINVTPLNPRAKAFHDVVNRALTNSINKDEEHAGFVSAVAEALHSYLERKEESRFMDILTAVWSRLMLQWSPRKYTHDDVKTVLNSLIHDGKALFWNMEQYGKSFRLNDRSLVWNSLFEFRKG